MFSMFEQVREKVFLFGVVFNLKGIGIFLFHIGFLNSVNDVYF
jgi:hypothetical protein